KTNRAVIVEESWRTLGLGAQIAAPIQEAAFDYLDAPVGRVGSLEVPMPYARNLERLVIPAKDEVNQAVLQALAQPETVGGGDTSRGKECGNAPDGLRP